MRELCMDEATLVSGGAVAPAREVMAGAATGAISGALMGARTGTVLGVAAGAIFGASFGATAVVISYSLKPSKH